MKKGGIAMTNQASTPTVDPMAERTDPFIQVHDGMVVYDAMGKQIGRVSGAYSGAGSPLAPTAQAPVDTPVAAVPVPISAGAQQPAPLMQPVMQPVASVEGADLDLPREMRERLLHDGFMRIDAGFLRHHRYALREQIQRVEGDSVMLNVPFDALIKH